MATPVPRLFLAAPNIISVEAHTTTAAQVASRSMEPASGPPRTTLAEAQTVTSVPDRYLVAHGTASAARRRITAQAQITVNLNSASRAIAALPHRAAAAAVAPLP